LQQAKSWRRARKEPSAHRHWTKDSPFKGSLCISPLPRPNRYLSFLPPRTQDPEVL
jgi:hypothetical protein